MYIYIHGWLGYVPGVQTNDLRSCPSCGVVLRMSLSHHHRQECPETLRGTVQLRCLLWKTWWTHCWRGSHFEHQKHGVCMFVLLFHICIQQMYKYIYMCMYMCIYVYLFPWRKPDWWVLGLEAWKVTFCSSSWVGTAATLNFFLKMSTSFEARAETTNIYVQKTAIDPPNRLGDAAGRKVCLSLG